MATQTSAPRPRGRRRHILVAVWVALVVLIAGVIGTAVFTSTQIVNGALSVASEKANVFPYNLDTWGYQGDPTSALGLQFRDVTYDTPLGKEPAWVVAGERDGRWVVLVHGKGGERSEMLRNVEYFHGRGDNVLVISFRNDAGSPEDPSGYYQYGLTEEADLLGAVDYLVDEWAAKDIVLFGNSAGGGIVLAYLESGSANQAVTAAILDSPIIDLPRTLVWNMKDIPIPAPILGLGTYFARVSTGLDFDRIDFRDAPAHTTVPILIVHGTEDLAAPLSASQAMAEEYPSRVTLVEFPGAGHCQSWNRDRPTYERSLSEFLAAVP